MQATVTDYRTDVVVLALHGDLDTDTARTLHDALDRLLAHPAPRIVVDLAGLAFCDSTGLSAFVTGRDHAVQHGGWLRLAAPTVPLRQLLETVGLTRYLTIYPDVERAVDGG